jgi:hypothetical protein
MMKLGKIVGAGLVMIALLVMLPGCQKQEGPAERAGKEVDKAVGKAGNEVDKAAEKVGEQVEKTGDKIQDAAKDDKK